jgi:hypothetical protein
VSDSVLEVIAETCQQVKCLNLAKNDKITSSGINTLLSKLGSEIRWLDLSRCDIPKNYLEEILKLCPKLQYLRIVWPRFDKPSCALVRNQIDNVEVLSEESDDTDEENEEDI